MVMMRDAGASGPAPTLERGSQLRQLTRRLRGFARAYAQGRLRLADINPSVQAWLGHARHADTFGLRQSLFNAVSFTRGADR